MNARASRPQLWPEIRLMLLAAMVIFLYTVGIGVLNGTDIVDFDQRRILGHVHGGTLGWLTLAVFSASLWLFRELKPVSDRERTLVCVLAWAAIVVSTVYIFVFSVTYNEWRPAFGVLAMLVYLAFIAWIRMRSDLDQLTVPHLGFLTALATSIVGGILGVLWGMLVATGNSWLPTDGVDAYPATMVVGFLLPVVMAMSEWVLRYPDPPKATRLGIAQMAFPFAGGIVLMLALLFGVDPLAPAAVLLEVVGVVIFLRRLWPDFKTVNWMEASSGRYAAAAALSATWSIGLAQYFIIRHDGDFDLVPFHQILALDQLTFLLVNLGIIGFVVALLGDITVMKQIFAPTMGAGLLVGLALFAWRLLLPDSEVAST